MNSPVLTAAIYARVSSETHAVDRQVETAKARMQTDGLTLETEFTFLDSGYSGAARPGAATPSSVRDNNRSNLYSIA